ncbi:MAG: 16S rRNA (guanine(966)-N(2))-methyltransferase RsmD [Myxococcales bacterium]|nr:16S rRNA (guanine(966)-N(2))-methyltransferase RsmD [Myxococcales bacterium]
MRVIAGEAKGRKLVTAKGLSTRPTSDKVREAIFGAIGPDVVEARVLDLFAGSGAMGIEALSRGAGFAVFVEPARGAVAAIEQNLATCALGTRADIVQKKFPVVLGVLQDRKDRFDFAFVDPPYGTDVIYEVLKHLVKADIFAPGALLVAEHDSRDKVRADVLGLRVAREKTYGSTAVTFLEC